MKEMNKGVQILLERMRSNPDEFVPNVHGYYPDKWSKIIMAIEMRTNGGKDYKDQLPFLNDEEVKALWNGMQQLQGELFTKKVMNILLQDAQEFQLSDVPTTLAPLMATLSSTAELSSSFRQPNDASKKMGSSTITLSSVQNMGAMSGTISAKTAVGKLRYP